MLENNDILFSDEDVFTVNGLEINLKELEDFENILRSKNRLTQQPISSNFDDLDEYLENLKLNEKSSTDKENTYETGDTSLLQYNPYTHSPSFTTLLLMFTTILNLLNFLICKIIIKL